MQSVEDQGRIYKTSGLSVTLCFPIRRNLGPCKMKKIYS